MISENFKLNLEQDSLQQQQQQQQYQQEQQSQQQPLQVEQSSEELEKMKSSLYFAGVVSNQEELSRALSTFPEIFSPSTYSSARSSTTTTALQSQHSQLSKQQKGKEDEKMQDTLRKLSIDLDGMINFDEFTYGESEFKNESARISQDLIVQPTQQQQQEEDKKPKHIESIFKRKAIGTLNSPWEAIIIQREKLEKVDEREDSEEIEECGVPASEYFQSQQQRSSLRQQHQMEEGTEFSLGTTRQVDFEDDQVSIQVDTSNQISSERNHQEQQITSSSEQNDNVDSYLDNGSQLIIEKYERKSLLINQNSLSPTRKRWGINGSEQSSISFFHSNSKRRSYLPDVNMSSERTSIKLGTLDKKIRLKLRPIHLNKSLIPSVRPNYEPFLTLEDMRSELITIAKEILDAILTKARAEHPHKKKNSPAGANLNGAFGFGTNRNKIGASMNGRQSGFSANMQQQGRMSKRFPQ